MIRTIFVLLSLLCLSCSSDIIISSEKTSFYKIYKDIVMRDPISIQSKDKNGQIVYDKAWLSEFNQPIISLSSLDGKNTATLVALGNSENKLTWVSSDGISVSFLNGILIATRGYSQDLMEVTTMISTFFSSKIKNRLKKYRYLNGENEYKELHFTCSIEAKQTPQPFF